MGPSHRATLRIGYFSLIRIHGEWVFDEGDLFYYHKRWWQPYANWCLRVWPRTFCRRHIHHIGYMTTPDVARMVIHRRGHVAAQQMWVGTCTWCKRVLDPPRLIPPAADVAHEARWDHALGKWV